MKKLFVMLLLTTTALLSVSTAFAAERTVKLSVPGMTCASCPFIVKSAISAVKGVTGVQTALADHSATVTFDDAVASVEAITKATKNAGYESTVIDAQPKS
jgi:mercuric ion binding protein